METKARRAGETLVIDIAGDVNMLTSDSLRDELKELVKENETRVAINLSGVAFMDSSGIATLVECLGRVRKQGGTLRLFGVRDRIRDMFAMARLDKMFSICQNEAEALTK
ncbi:MAG: STAS domain-containing protein [Planctomycetota bacterium]